MHCFVDVETTGLDYIRNEIVSISSIICDQELNKLRKKTIKVRPENLHYWSEESEKIHGFSKDDCLNHTPKNEAIAIFEEFLFEDKIQRMAFVCHAKSMYGEMDYFDYNMVKQWFVCEYGGDTKFYKTFPPSMMRSTILNKGY